VSVGVSHELSSMAISIISLYKFYDSEGKLIQRAENALQSSRYFESQEPARTLLLPPDPE